MSYSIEPDDLIGRVFLTKLPNGVEVSTVQLSERDKDPRRGQLLAVMDGFLGRDGDYETAIVSDKVRVVASADTIEGAKACHRRAVEELFDCTHQEKKEPPLLRMLRG